MYTPRTTAGGGRKRRRQPAGARTNWAPTTAGVTGPPQSVGMGSYNMDSHNCVRYVTADGSVQNEGDIQQSPGGPYRISYKSLVPRKAECPNLLVPICVSSSHIAYGSIRMEPVFFILG